LNAPLPSGATIGILGGGQLGRMTAMAAARLGYRCHIFAPEDTLPAGDVATGVTRAAYDDSAALEAFAAQVQTVTCEFENVPAETLEYLARLVPVQPDARAFAIAQDRLAEKRFLNQAGIATAPFHPVASANDVAAALAELGDRGLLKSNRLGYDGKGQVRLTPDSSVENAWQELNTDGGIVEGWIDFACEVSVIIARGQDGVMAAYDPSENVHRDGILRTATVPARLDRDAADTAIAIARRIAESLDLVGLVAVEMFVTGDGAVLVNEIAPRPHNSGHWTIDACACSQFEQCVRAVGGLPLGMTFRHSDAVMTNLIGDDMDGWPDLVAEPGACLHLYGKNEARPGRKMGHVTRLSPRGSSGTTLDPPGD